VLYELELKDAKTIEDYIAIRWKHMVEVLSLMPSEIGGMGTKCSLPEYIRPYNEDYWKEWGQSKYKPTPKEHEMAIEASWWVHHAAEKREAKHRDVVIGIIFIHSFGQSFRNTAKVVKERTRKKYSHSTCKKWFDQAIQDVAKKVKEIPSD